MTWLMIFGLIVWCIFLMDQVFDLKRRLGELERRQADLAARPLQAPTDAEAIAPMASAVQAPAPPAPPAPPPSVRASGCSAAPPSIRGSSGKGVQAPIVTAKRSARAHRPPTAAATRLKTAPRGRR